VANFELLANEPRRATVSDAAALSRGGTTASGSYACRSRRINGCFNERLPGVLLAPSGRTAPDTGRTRACVARGPIATRV